MLTPNFFLILWKIPVSKILYKVLSKLPSHVAKYTVAERTHLSAHTIQNSVQEELCQ